MTVIRKIHLRLYIAFPNLISSPFPRDQEYYEQSDISDNKQTQPPDDDDIRMPAVWGVEIFGPSEIKDLYISIKKLGWDNFRRGGIYPSSVDWIKNARSYGTTGTLNIGVIVRKEDVSRLAGIAGPVPDNVEYLIVNIHQMTPAITCVLVGFVLNDDISKRFEEILSKKFKTLRRTIFRKLTHTVLRVEHLKQEAIDEQRAIHRRMVRDWFKQNMFGFLSGSNGGISTAELLTTRHSRLMKTSSEEIQEADWERILVPYSWNDTWTSDKYQGMRLRLGDDESKNINHIFISLKTDSLPEDEFAIYGGKTKGSLVAFTNQNVAGVLYCLASLNLLVSINSFIKHSLENTRTAGSSYDDAQRSIDGIKKFFDKSLGIPNILSNLLDQSKNMALYRLICHKFLARPAYDIQGPEQQLAEILCDSVKHYSESILLEEKVVREHFGQLASIISVRENIRTQKRMELLTIIAVVVAFNSLLVVLIPEAWVAFLKANIQHLLE